ncbi:MAG TPA: NifU family protein [Candidatus Syntrophoarchaeum butanivorans]|uniref:NifU family protein n=1 Tax=Candidatus Syntropharchaeum butanivorans TaxID=1839936 RepID=A0A1F2P3V9_9EURY|nr:MAG: nitrogen-fixing protein NifU [Candidatus Syntrophoarchaeum butanivorans]OFV66528.1 MAG: nitrogen-fixing protein NifU [Candidatus Syntrophoarchaeum butanivorans]RJS73235.1 MAG: NifU family protein [Candidatus Syntrophoarchaeum sp. WYZ-LMO15]HEC57612.1 NifU family protein [Candidatus Syntrophoarchaeum butanivorans]
MREKVEAVIKQIRPFLQAEGGDVELVDVDEKGVVKVRLQGACAGCIFSQMTLANVIEQRIREAVPEIDHVEAV